MNMTDAKRAGCRFCSVLNGAEDAFNSTWLAEDAYKALISVGAFVPGWTLICPISHSVNLADHYTRQDFWDFASAAAEIIAHRYGECAFFEHGAGCETSLTGCGVGHAHGHLVPLNFSLEVEARQIAPELGWKECRAADIKAVANGSEYLFVASTFNGSETKGSLCLLETPTSQFFRQVIAGKLGISELFDYKKYPMLETARTSADELREHACVAVVGA